MVSSAAASPAAFPLPSYGYARFTLVLFSCLMWAVGINNANGHPYTIRDQLKLQDVGRGATDPQNRRVVWEQAVAYSSQPDFSIGYMGTWEGAYQLMAVDLSSDHRIAAPLFPPDPRRQYWFDSFSPTGRYVLFQEAMQGRFGLGVYDTETRRVSYLSSGPAVPPYSQRAPVSVWISNESFVYCSYPAGMQPYSGLRRAYGETLWKSWNKSWSGRAPSVTVAESHGEPQYTKFRSGRLNMLNARAGTTAVLARGRYDSLALSPGGRFLAALRQAELPQRISPESIVDWTISRSELVIFDLNRVASPPITVPSLDIFPETLVWAPDGNRVAFFGWPIGSSVRKGTFWAFDTRTGDLVPYPHIGLDLASERERGWFQRPERQVWVGSDLAVFARPITDKDLTPRFTYRDRGSARTLPKADWYLVSADGHTVDLTAEFHEISPVPLYSDGASVTLLADGAVWSMYPGRPPKKFGGSVTQPLTLPSTSIDSPDRRAFQSPAILTGGNSSAPTIAVVDFAQQEISEFATPSVATEPIAIAPKARSMLYRQRGMGRDQVILQAFSGLPLVLQKLNLHLSKVTGTPWRTIKYKANIPTVDRELTGCLLLPSDYIASRRYPVVVDVYPSREPSCDRSTPGRYAEIGGGAGAYSPNLLAARGYIVFQPSFPRDLIRTSAGPINGMPELARQGVNELIRQGYADPSRIAIIGYSQGAFASLWTATNLGLFRAVVAINGWSDMYSEYFEGIYPQRTFPSDFPYAGDRERYASAAGTEFPIAMSPRDDLDSYARNSPLFRSRDMHGAVLLASSDMDGFSLSQFEMMFTALYQQGKEAKLLQYWGEGHGPSSPANLVHLWSNIFAWLDHYLDVSRDESGEIKWDTDRVLSRNGEEPRSPEWFETLDKMVIKTN